MEAQKKRISPYIYLIIIVLSYLTAGFCQYRLQPILTYMMQGMQIDEGKAGVLVSALSILSIFLAVPFGVMMGKIGPRRTGIFAMILIIAGSLVGVFGTKSYTVMFLSQLVAKQMISQEPVDGRKGVIVNVSSCSSVVSSTNRGEYCVSKAGISMLTTLYADRLAAEGILVNEVRPGVIATDMTSTVQGKYDALIEKGTFPIARWGTPEDVAGAVSLLCSDRLRYTTGNYIDVDGGFHIQRL